MDQESLGQTESTGRGEAVDIAGRDQRKTSGQACPAGESIHPRHLRHAAAGKTNWTAAAAPLVSLDMQRCIITEAVVRRLLRRVDPAFRKARSLVGCDVMGRHRDAADSAAAAWIKNHGEWHETV
jgi:hypothetical protein